MTSNPFFPSFFFRLESLSGNFARKRDDKKKKRVEEEDGIKNKTSKATTSAEIAYL